MIVKGPIITEIGKLVLEAQNRVIEGMNDGRIETEPSITERFVDSLENVFDGYSNRKTNLGITFRARSLRDRGREAPESKYGADFCGVLDIQSKAFRQRKGFLSQSKWERDGKRIRYGYHGLKGVTISTNNAEYNRLLGQVDDMLSITPDSFVFVYARTGFLVVPATSIRGLTSEAELYAKSVDQFFKEFAMCFIGDPRLNAWDDATLEELKTKTHSRSVFLLQMFMD